MPINTQSPAKSPILTYIITGTSLACLACSVRGKARNEIPNALIKHVATNAPVKATTAPQMIVSILMSTDGMLNPFSKDWKISHSLMNPFNGGIAEIAKAPTRNKGAVTCNRLIRPPNSSMFFV